MSKELNLQLVDILELEKCTSLVAYKVCHW